MKHKGVTLKNIILLQAIIIIYTVSSVMAKFASANKETPIKFFLFLGLEFAILAVYAVLWQQMIKRFDLSIAYANRAMALLWSAVWAVVLFHENLNGKQIAGILLVILGTVIVNTQQPPKEDKKEEEAV